VRIEVDGRTTAEVTLHPPKSRLHGLRRTAVTVDVPVSGAEVRILSDTFVPADVLGGDDHRRLGVPVEALRVGTGTVGRLLEHVPVVLDVPASSTWTGSYGAFVANSEFTRGWVRRWWDRDSEVLYPPVSMHTPADKQRVILNAGRFFDASQGHSKKQLELVQAFKTLCDRGTTDWTLHLVGGCAGSGTAYLEQVRLEAQGYPVELHPDAPGEVLESLYKKASIYWHASGFGEDAQRHPERTEHFGITIVEAMSAGAVPVVIGLAGPLETVRDGVDGYHFQTLGELIDRTEALIADDERRTEMSAAARARAQDFSTGAFEARLRAIVSRVVWD
jgi:glycosyltransferase involved in cell wall biosynthesis